MPTEPASHGPQPDAGRVDAAPAAGAAPSAVPAEERQWAMLAHVSAMLGYVSGLLGIVAVFVIWLLKRETMPLVADQGRESLNFQLTILAGLLISLPLMLVVVGFFLAGALVVYHFVFTIVAAVKATEGVAYRYPFCWRPLK